MPSTSSPLAARRPTISKAVFSVGRPGVLRNTQQARKTRPYEVKLEGKRSLTTMQIHASGTRPSPQNVGAATPSPLSRTSRFLTLGAVLNYPEGGQP